MTDFLQDAAQNDTDYGQQDVGNGIGCGEAGGEGLAPGCIGERIQRGGTGAAAAQTAKNVGSVQFP